MKRAIFGGSNFAKPDFFAIVNRDTQESFEGENSGKFS